MILLESIEWPHIILESAALGITMFGLMWGYRREDRKERRELRETAQAKQLSMHEENKRTFGELKVGQTTIEQKLELIPLHAHTEKEGVLRAENIYPPRD